MTHNNALFTIISATDGLIRNLNIWAMDVGVKGPVENQTPSVDGDYEMREPILTLA